MRRIAAHIAFTGEEYIENPLVELDDTGLIVALGQFSTEKGEPAGTEFFSGMLTPAFINAHTHLELSYQDCTYDKGLGMSDFIRHVVQTRKSKNAPGKSRLKSLLRKMHAEGTIAFADICNSDLSFPAKMESPHKHVDFFEFFALSASQAEEKMSAYRSLKAKYPNENIFPAFHSPYAMSEDGLSVIKDVFKDPRISSLHFRESKEELNLIDDTNTLTRFYRTLNPAFEPVFKAPSWVMSQGQYLKSVTSLLLVHNLYLTEAGILELKQWAGKNKIQLAFVLSPRSNFNIHRVLPPVDILQKHNLPLCVGTDSLMSATSLSVMDEIKYLGKHFPKLKMSDVLKMLTSNPAKALEFKELGSLSPGMRPGINGIRMKNLRSDLLDQDAEIIRLV